MREKYNNNNNNNENIIHKIKIKQTATFAFVSI